MRERVFILGLGSIGQRHARNALALGCEVIGYDVRPATPELRAGLMPGVTLVDSLKAGLDKKPLGVIVATPPNVHMVCAGPVIDVRIPLLIEKPLSDALLTAEGIGAAAEAYRLPLAVGYQFRHTASLRRLKAQTDAGEFGTIYAAHVEFASQKWCSHTYPADLLLECTHELDIVRWFMGDPQSAAAHLGSRELASIILAFGASRAATVKLDGYAPGYRRRLMLYGTRGQGEWVHDQAENDQAYVDELAEFLRVCRGEQAAPSCTVRDGWWTLRMVEAIRKSGESGRWESI